MGNNDKPGLRDRLDAGEFIVAPGVYDLISARLADRYDFAALYMTGYGVTASYLGLPDAGLASYTQMLDRVSTIAGGVSKPLIADADTGYGGLLNVDHTVRGYEQAGAAAVQIEDQVFPKKCGHTPGREVIPCDDMVKKIEVAVAARASRDLLIVARTDARAVNGLDDAISRGRAYAEAGADVIFIEAPRSVDEMRSIAQAIDAPLLANMVNGGSTPILSATALRDLGYQVAIFPGTAFLAAAAAIDGVYRHLQATGEGEPPVPVYEFEDFSRLMDFERVWAFERRWADTESDA